MKNQYPDWLRKAARKGVMPVGWVNRWGNFGELCRSIARGVKLSSVAPVRGESSRADSFGTCAVY